jgi:hypothetical protein
MEKVKQLYEIAMLLFNSHVNNTANCGSLDYSDKEYGYLSDALDEVKIGCFKQEADGDREEYLVNQKFSLTEQEGIELLALRIGRVMEEFE